MIPTSIDGTDITGATIDGTDVTEITVDGDTVFSAFSGPDDQIYLHDDYNDNKLSSRDNSDTVTYKGVTGVYRPEWTTFDSLNLPSVSGGAVNMTGGDGIVADINLNLNETITWRWEIDMTNNVGGSRTGLHLFTEQKSVSASDHAVQEGYDVFVRDSGSVGLERTESSGISRSGLITKSGGLTSTHTIEVTRTSAGTFELFIDSVSEGTATDTTYTNPQFMPFKSISSANVKIDEVKVV